MLALALVGILYSSLYAVATPRPANARVEGLFVARDESVTPNPTADPGPYTIQTSPSTPSPSTTSDNANDSGEDDSDDNIPTVCLYGCYKAFDFFEGYYPGAPGDTCYTQNTSEACTPVCTGANYTALVTCLECVVANGEEYLDAANATITLDWINGVCERAGVSGFQPSTTITATATTTGEFTWLPTGTAYPSAWTGFTSYLAQLTASSSGEYPSGSPASSAPAETFTRTISSSMSSTASDSVGSLWATSYPADVQPATSASASSGAVNRNVVSKGLLGGALLAMLMLVLA